MPETQYTSEVSQQNLEVVSKELTGTLHNARIALEEFVEDQSKTPLLEKTASHLHEAHGVLRMVEIYGAALLTEEMEKVIAYLLESRRTEKIQTDAVEALSRSMLQLPTYLDRVISGGRDIALILLPLLNDLRAVRGKPLLSEGTLLLLNLTPRRNGAAPPAQQVAEPRPDIREVAARVRPKFQTSLLGWIRNSSAVGELDTLAKIAESLELSATTTEVTQLWAIAGAIIEALKDKGLETSVSLKRLLGQTDRQIKRLVDKGEEHGGGEDPAGELRNNLLYYVARATGNGTRVSAIRNLYRLDEVLPGDAQIEEARDSLSAPSVKLMRTVGSAIKEDLARVKDVFDIFVRTGMENIQELRPQAEMLKKISDTLGVLGLGELRALVMNETRQLTTMLDEERPPDEAMLLRIAATVLKVEDKLDEDLLQLILPGPPQEPVDEDYDSDSEREYRQVANAVLRECVVNIARVKEAMTQALQKEDFLGMDQVSDLMKGVTAGLLMLGKSRAVGQSEKISTLIQERVQPGLANLKGEQLDRLADAIVSLEYYMQTLRSGRSDPWYMLDNVDGCLKVLASPSTPSTIPKISEPAEQRAPEEDATHVRIDEPAPDATGELPVLVDRPLDSDDERLDPEFLELFIEEARDEIAIIRKHFAIWRAQADNKESLTRMRRSFHTLKGSGRMVGATRIAEFAWISENLLNRIIDRTKKRSADVVRTLEANIVVLPELLDELEAGTPVGADIKTLMSETQRLTEIEDDADGDDDTQLFEIAAIGDETMIAKPFDEDDHATLLVEQGQPEPGMDPVLKDIFVKESTGHLTQIRAWIENCEEGAAPYPITEDLYRACHTLHGSAKMAGAMQGVKIAEPFDRLLRKLHDLGRGLDEDGLTVCFEVVRSFDEIIGHLEEDTGFFPTHRELSDRIRNMEAALESEYADAAEANDALDIELIDEEAFVTPDSVEQDDEVEFDAEIAAIFSEEAAELLESAEHALSALREDSGDSEASAELQRALHTIKGGARMAGIGAMGDLSHDTESLIDRVTTGALAFDEPVADALQAALDTLHTMREQVGVGQPAEADGQMVARILALSAGGAATEPAPPEVDQPMPAEPEPEPEPEPESEPESSAVDESLDELEALLEQAEHEPGAPPEAEKLEAPEVPEEPEVPEVPEVPEAPEVPEVADAAQPPPPPIAPPMRRESADRQEFTRVEIDRLDEMLNYAGEISIYRSRLDQQMRSIDFNLAELSRTVIRMRDQLRKLEIETETHILSHHEQESRAGEFDPLELDQYSLIQQLSKALAESVNDVASLRDLLESQANESDALLSQQARLTADLQSSLMHTRMVPFSRYDKRLGRIVRQAANDAGRKAQLRLEGASGELDRQVLERMMQPLEHLLRNSVVHGIEAHEGRAAAEKPETGDICIALQREGSEMIIRVGDDGAGIDAGAVRRKAIARGLLDASETLPDEQVRQMIFRPGFSTAGELTQAAGRGVGLDVVATEVERLGGSVHVESEHGKGTQFVIRLPFTLAITQAMVVRVGDEHYALPLPTVEGIARMPRHRVTERLEEDDPQFEYGGRQYRLRHLAHFVEGHSSGFADEELSVSIILVRAGSHSTALVADELLGSREIVVKSVGPQVAGIVGISGGTILGDGSVALILDLGGLVRSEAARRRPTPLAREADTRTFVLVVDDSITVRRVTQRLLERNGMRVITAKDGVDALALLQEHHPDIILLDIEMPRMDGYELASQIRSDERLKDVPIVMITSRTGRKHRARAIELGVNDYLGKPYQETQLLDAIEPLVKGDTR